MHSEITRDFGAEPSGKFCDWVVKYGFFQDSELLVLLKTVKTLVGGVIILSSSTFTTTENETPLHVLFKFFHEF